MAKQKLQFVECKETGDINLWSSGCCIWSVCKGCGKNTNYDSKYPYHSHYHLYEIELVKKSLKLENYEEFYDRGKERILANKSKYLSSFN